jgi:prephenate dehydratase
LIRSVRSFVLGPEGTNIMQAADRWHQKMRITEKAELVSCDTPEEAVLRARATTAKGVLAIYWTCAVFVRENRVFFDNPDTLPFGFQQIMQLDEMQLATRAELASEFVDPSLRWRILSHPSPAPLVSRLGWPLVEANSNSDAARRCAAGEAEACITTETSRQLNGLVKLHSFGSPEMVFFGGICRHGAKLLRNAFAGLTLSRKLKCGVPRVRNAA